MLLQAPAGGTNWYSLVLMGGIFVVMYFFMIRPQQKKAKDQQKFVDDLKEGDQVVTIGGLHGKIVETTDKTVTLDVGRGMRLVFEKTAISRESSQRLAQ